MILLRLTILITLAVLILTIKVSEVYAFFITVTYALSLVIIIHRFLFNTKEKNVRLVNIIYSISAVTFLITFLGFFAGYSAYDKNAYHISTPEPYKLIHFAFPLIGTVLIPFFYFYIKRSTKRLN